MQTVRKGMTKMNATRISRRSGRVINMLQAFLDSGKQLIEVCNEDSEYASDWSMYATLYNAIHRKDMPLRVYSKKRTIYLERLELKNE